MTHVELNGSLIMITLLPELYKYSQNLLYVSLEWQFHHDHLIHHLLITSYLSYRLLHQIMLFTQYFLTCPFQVFSHWSRQVGGHPKVLHVMMTETCLDQWVRRRNKHDSSTHCWITLRSKTIIYYNNRAFSKLQLTPCNWTRTFYATPRIEDEDSIAKVSQKKWSVLHKTAPIL